MNGPLATLRARIQAGELTPDDHQRLAAERLQDLWSKLRGYDPPPRAAFRFSRLLRFRAAEGQNNHPNGLYLVGDVGRGKSMLMDLFFETAEVARKRRLHFHGFMTETHATLAALRAETPDLADPIPPLADRIAAAAALLCFDEFQINDIADALILGRLFQALFERGVVIVATSNTAPDDLFRGRPGRDAFQPFIDILKRHLDVLVLEGARDWRRDRLRQLHTWHVDAATGALDAAFRELANGETAKPCRLRVLGRDLQIPRAAAGIARFTFGELCAAALGPADYLALATHFHTLVLDDIPRLSPERADEARRFIVLVDTLYEHRVKLIATAADSPDALHPQGEAANAFQRTASRLTEMQSAEYLALPHLT